MELPYKILSLGVRCCELCVPLFKAAVWPPEWVLCCCHDKFECRSSCSAGQAEQSPMSLTHHIRVPICLWWCLLDPSEDMDVSVSDLRLLLTTIKIVLTAVLAMSMMTIGTINVSTDNTPVSFDGIPEDWEIKSSQIRLHCVDGKPVELGR